MDSLTEKEFDKLSSGSEKVQYIRGQIPNFEDLCTACVHETLNETRDDFGVDHPEHDEIVEAFRIRVQNYMTQASTVGGHKLDHLPQGHGSILTQAEYRLLHAEAAQLTAILFERAGFEEHAKQRHQLASHLLAHAKDRFRELRKNVEVRIPS